NFTTGLLRYGSVGSTGPINENRRLLAYSQSSGPKPTKAISMSTEAVRQANLAAITCEPRPQLPDGFRRNSARVGALLGAARTGLSVTSFLPARLSAPTTTKILKRNGSWSSQARQPCVIRAARTSSNRGTSSSFPPAPPG